MKKVTCKVIKGTRGYGYSLMHNQPAGYKGIIGSVWAWYRYKRDAIEAAEAFERANN